MPEPLLRRLRCFDCQEFYDSEELHYCTLSQEPTFPYVVHEEAQQGQSPETGEEQ